MSHYSNSQALTLAEQQQLRIALDSLKSQNLIADRGLFDLWGRTTNGEFVWAPGSLARGYQDCLATMGQSTTIKYDLGLVGIAVDWSLVYLPSYRRGYALALEKIGNVKMAFLAESQRILHQQVESLKSSQIKIQEELQATKLRLQELEQQRSKQNE